MLSPGAAFLLAYLPARRLALRARGRVLDRVAGSTDPKLAHAVEFARAGMKIEDSLVAEPIARLVAIAAANQVSLPAPLPDDPTSAVAAAVQPHVIAPVLQAAWSAGETACAIHRGIEVAADLAYLRCAAPDEPTLRAEAEANARAVDGDLDTFTTQLQRTGLPVVRSKAGNVASLVRRTRDLAPATNDGHRALNELSRTVAAYFDAISRDLDVPAPAQASSAPTQEELDLLATILAEPWADAPRLRLAELAALRGDPRAELIREQLAQRAARDAGNLVEEAEHLERARALILSHPEWSAAVLALGARDVKFWRGFPDEITIDAGAWLARGHEILAAAPITWLHVRAAAGRVRELVTSPLLRTIAGLDLDDQGVTDDDALALAASPHVSHLRALDLRFDPITARGIEAIAASDHLRGLARVSLDANPASPIDQREDSEETNPRWMPTVAGRALEETYGLLRWLHPGGVIITPPILLGWARQLCERAKVSRNDVLAVLRLTGELQHTRDYATVQPPPEGCVKVEIIDDIETHTILRHVDFVLAMPLTLGDLVTELGAGKTAVRTGAMSPHQHWWMVSVDDAPCRCDIFATFDDDEKPTSVTPTNAIRLRYSG